MHIEERGKSLIIRWRVDSKKYHKTLKNHNNPIGWSNAKSLMASIEKDILSGHFDPTPYTDRGKAKKQNIDLTASELFAKYAAHRMEGRELSHSSRVRFKGIASKLTQFLGDKPAGKVTPDIAANVIAAWSEQASTRTIRAYLFDLAAAWDWAQQEDLYILSDINPWNNSLDRLKRVKLPAPKKPKPFTIAELKAIAQEFRNHPKHSYYTDAAIFVAHTACRFGEMAALRWLNVGANFDTVLFDASVSRGHHRDTTKTGESRTVIVTKTVVEMLRSRHEQTDPKPDDLVFPAVKGGYLDDDYFRAKVWKPLLASCGVEYRKPYNLRHTGVSHAAAQGAILADLAAQTGHSKKVLMNTYLHAIDRKCLFVDF
ncbi:site-specific integrase [Chamaesiphon sp. OTE_8_metabat_110]|uniref:site-specific integrase n=1 Tax=Chamaesiphon sp. OTE_8_metabat_110 TaxID=2964696 RepID=UPI00286A8A45|nr:site-specific integrase [Chamaesiphon sp. OTE_8_metabat_110]